MRAYTVADAAGETLYTLSLCHLRSATPAPIERLTLLASSVEQAGAWIIKQGFPAFTGWKIDRVREPAKEQGFIVLRSPKGNAYKIAVDARPLHPPVVKSFEAMTPEEKFAALASAVQAVQAKDDLKLNWSFTTWQR
jgi:hypothetical protein